MMRAFAAIALVAACGKTPATRYYQLSPPEQRSSVGELVLVIEHLTTDPAYDDERIVYRPSPYRLDYYEYHRWSSEPGTLVGNFLESALERSGTFRAVVRELDPDAAIVLGGRVVSIEEVDITKTRWVGRVVIELVASDARTGATLWTEQIEETEPLAQQTPEGLARALSIAMGRVANRIAPVLADTSKRQLNASR